MSHSIDPTGIGMRKSAQISACGTFRYGLGRDWSVGRPSRWLLFVMLNPSTADADVDDPTIRRCMGFAHAHGFNGLAVVNLYAYRSPSPRALRDAGWPIGPENDANIAAAASEAHGVCLAWGSFAARTPRAGQVLQILRANLKPGVELQCLDTTGDGHPKHPLYLSSALRLKPFEVRHA